MWQKNSIVTFAAVVTLLALPVAAQVRFLDESFPYDEAAPALGSWVGNITQDKQPGVSIFAFMTLKREDDGAITSTLTFLPAGALNKVVKTIEIEGRKLALGFSGAGSEYRFEGIINESGQRYNGTVTIQAAEEDEPKQGVFEFARTPQPMDLAQTMAYTGNLEAQGIKLGMSFVLAETPEGNWVGHLDVPMQMLKEFPLINFKVSGEYITAEIPVPGGASVEFSLGTMRLHMSGKFKQAGQEMPFDFTRDMNYAFRELVRPQEPKPPFPYTTREIGVSHPDGFTLAGTLTIPDSGQFGSGPFPLAILITGSGQQDRDEALLGHKPFLVLADHLTRQGIAVMRYDDRGVGASGGLDTLESTTSEDNATDALAVMIHMKTLDVIDSKRIGLIGHSEGGMIAPLVGTMTDDVAFMVLMAGPGVSGRELLLLQRRLLGRASGATDGEMDFANRQFTEIDRLISNGGSEDEVVALFLKFARNNNQNLEKTDEQLTGTIRPQAVTLMSPWFRYFMDFEPADYLSKVTCPVLAINGTLDLQVWHEQNLDAIIRIMEESGGDLTARRYEGLNHLFQPAETGSVAEYAQIEITMDETVLSDIATWINAKVN